MKKQLSFSTIKLRDLRQIVSLKPNIDKKVFDKWFKCNYTLSDVEILFLNELIAQNDIRLPYYSEEELKMKFIAPLLNKIDFTINEVTDWYERPIGVIINGYELKGVTDYLVAKGISEPEKPYFFIQEFKPSKTSSDPEDQLLAELLTAIHLTDEEEALGAVIIGQLWIFLLLKKEKDNTFQYFKSSGFNTLNITELQQLYIALKGVKQAIVEQIK